MQFFFISEILKVKPSCSTGIKDLSRTVRQENWLLKNLESFTGTYHIICATGFNWNYLLVSICNLFKTRLYNNIKPQNNNNPHDLFERRLENDFVFIQSFILRLMVSDKMNTWSLKIGYRRNFCLERFCNSKNWMWFS